MRETACRDQGPTWTPGREGRIGRRRRVREGRALCSRGGGRGRAGAGRRGDRRRGRRRRGLCRRRRRCSRRALLCLSMRSSESRARLPSAPPLPPLLLLLPLAPYCVDARSSTPATPPPPPPPPPSFVDDAAGHVLLHVGWGGGRRASGVVVIPATAPAHARPLCARDLSPDRGWVSGRCAPANVTGADEIFKGEREGASLGGGGG